MLEAIRIRKAGYSIRLDFETTVKKYKPILMADFIVESMGNGGPNLKSL